MMIPVCRKKTGGKAIVINLGIAIAGGTACNRYLFIFFVNI